MFEIHLDEDIFEVVKNGTKRVEVRLNDEKRRKMKIGDKLIFLKRPLEEEKITTKIIGLKTFNYFEELVDNYKMKELFLDTYTKEDFIKLLERFYSKEEQEKNGVLAIEFEVE